MSTVFQQILEKGKEIGVKEGEKIGEEIGEEKGKKIGVKEGKDEEKLRVALTCLKRGIDIHTIAEITDLPVERIEITKKRCPTGKYRATIIVGTK